MSETDDLELIPAATVLLLRDGADDIEVLMVRRNSKIAFGGMWVFPGGRVDDDELDPADPIGSARRAAVREVEEETGLVISGDGLVEWSQWIPPKAAAMPTKGPRRRFSTWFFAVDAPDGEVAIDHGEIHDDVWISPTEAHRRHAAGEVELVPPTWITLWQLAQHRTVADALAWAADTPSRVFKTRSIQAKPPILAWSGDAEYGDGSTGRNRITLTANGWDYEFNPA